MDADIIKYREKLSVFENGRLFVNGAIKVYSSVQWCAEVSRGVHRFLESRGVHRFLESRGVKMCPVNQSGTNNAF